MQHSADRLVRRLAVALVAAYACLALASIYLGHRPLVQDMPRGLRAWMLGPLLLLATVPPAVMLWIVDVRPTLLTEVGLSWIRRASWVSVALNVVALPIVFDLWMYVLWGQQFASGVNGYYEALPADALRALNLPAAARLMPYGPLWAYVSAVCASVGGGTLGAYLALKVVAAVAWVVTLRAAGALTAQRSLQDQARGWLLLGWLPASLYLGVAEGHNDIVLAACIACWMLLRQRESPLGLMPLIAAVLVKYGAAPVLCVAVFDALVCRRWRDLLVGALTAAVAAVMMAPLWAGPGFFDGLTQQTSFSPLFSVVAAVHALTVGLAHLPESASAAIVLLVRLALVGVLALSALAHARAPSFDSLIRLAAAAVAVLLLAWNNVLPWYWLWLMPLLTLAPGTWVWRAMLPGALLLPIAQCVWFAGPLWAYQSKVAVIVYAVAGGWLVLDQAQRRRRSMTTA